MASDSDLADERVQVVVKLVRGHTADMSAKLDKFLGRDPRRSANAAYQAEYYSSSAMTFVAELDEEVVGIAILTVCRNIELETEARIKPRVVDHPQQHAEHTLRALMQRIRLFLVSDEAGVDRIFVEVNGSFGPGPTLELKRLGYHFHDMAMQLERSHD